MKKRPRRKILLAALLCVLPFHTLFGRDVEITVEDADLGIPLEEARIRSWDGTEYSCDEEGRLTLPVPDDRAVTIQAAYPGYENRRVSVPLGQTEIKVALRLGGVMENRELVVEGWRPETIETKSGRSVAIAGENLSRTAEIGLIEDVMTSIKLLPGVGYTGSFNAQPSIRGGEPSDLTAVLDGFYIERPYHWGGGYSIFDPRMVESARLSHGVFSTRYGHTISGLLEVSSRDPSPSEAELELGISSSAVSLSAAYPLRGKGGVMLMGKASYWDPFVWASKKLAGLGGDEELAEQLNGIRTAPYIRSGTVTGYYRFTADLAWNFTAFMGMDGVGVSFTNDRQEERLETSSDAKFDWANYLGFFTTNLTINPVSAMLLKVTLGAGFIKSDLDGRFNNSGKIWYSEDFLDTYDILDMKADGLIFGKNYYTMPSEPTSIKLSDTTVNYQGRFDLDWDLGKGFLFAAGAQELFSQWTQSEHAHTLYEAPASTFIPGGFIQSYPLDFTSRVKNKTFTSSLYTLFEYTSPNQRFGAEAGLRGDHVYFMGDGFSLQTMPELNPRLNLDFGILKNIGFVDGLSLTLGTGLFSSVNDLIALIEERYGIKDFDLRQNRSWTSVAGISVDFSGGFTFNVEGYYKKIFNRAYVSVAVNPASIDPVVGFDGKGRVWGFDFMLQKHESRYWDGWISYSFNHALYRDPMNVANGISVTGGRSESDDDWYFPSYHRFHNLNIVTNFKPSKTFNIAARLGLASGALIDLPGEKKSYPVYLVDENGTATGTVMEKWKRESLGRKRTTPSIPLDVKFSVYGFNPRGKARSEIYIAVENALALVYTSQGNTSFNSYTGKDDEGSNSASYELPIPMVSLGFKWIY